MLVAALLALLVLPACAVHTPPTTSPGSWSAVMGVAPGTAVRVWWFDVSVPDLPRHRMDGSVVGVDGTTITLDTRHGQQRVPRAQVHRVDVPGPPRPKDSPFRGMGIGGLVGVGITVMMAAENTSSDAILLPVIALVVGGGAAVGGLIDALHSPRDYRTIYFWEPARR